MKRKRFSVEQVVAAVKQHDFGVSATGIVRKLGIAEQTFTGGRSSMAAWRRPRSGN